MKSITSADLKHLQRIVVALCVISVFVFIVEEIYMLSKLGDSFVAHFVADLAVFSLVFLIFAITLYVCRHYRVTAARSSKIVSWERSMIKTLMEAWPDLVFIKDPDSRFIAANDATAEMMGAESAQDLIGKSDHDFFPKEMADEFRATEAEVIETGQPIVSLQERVASYGGKAAWLSTTKLPIRLNDEIVGIVGVNRNITEQKRLEAMLEQHRDHLNDLVAERTQELEGEKLKLEQALSKEKELSTLQRQFVSTVSHEFRTPLAVIDANAYRMERKIGRGVEGTELLSGVSTIRSSVVHLTDLMEGMLTASRIEAGTIEVKPECCDIKALIHDVVGMQRQVTRGRNIVVDVDPLPDSVVCDPRLMRHVLSNLLSNAIKFSTEATTVWLNGRMADDAIELSVKDEGVGIPKTEMARLFERFFRASTSEGIQGTGIGLHLVKQIVELHGGTISASSAPGEGSTFIIQLPADPAAKRE